MAKAAAKKANAAFMKPVTPDATLAAVVGSTPFPARKSPSVSGTTSEEQASGCKNRRMINADAALKAVFGGKSSVNMFRDDEARRQAPEVKRSSQRRA